MGFDPKPYLIQLPRRVKDPQTGHWTTRLDDYLEVKWRLVWFREHYPHGVNPTEEVCVDLERGYARYRGSRVMPDPESAMPMTIPTDASLPCSGQAISTLKPAQLAMLVSKVACLVQDDGDRWVPLLTAVNFA